MEEHAPGRESAVAVLVHEVEGHRQEEHTHEAKDRASIPEMRARKEQDG